MVSFPVRSLLYPPLEKIMMYSCTSRKVGLDAERQLPHAVDPPALDALSQIISPRILNSSPSIILEM